MKKSISTLLTVLFFIAPCGMETLAGNNSKAAFKGETQIISTETVKSKANKNVTKVETESKSNKNSEKTNDEKTQIKLDENVSGKQDVKKHLNKIAAVMAGLIVKIVDHSLAALPHILVKLIELRK